MRERWLGATGLRVPEIAVEGDDLSVEEGQVRLEGQRYAALIVESATDRLRIRDSYARGVPVLVRARTAAAVQAALSRPEVACALVPRSAAHLRELDLRALTYG